MIETNRLIIRPPKKEDIIPINKAINNSLEDIKKWLPWANDTRLEVTEEFIEDSIKEWKSKKQKRFPLVVILKEENKIVGGNGYSEKSDPLVPFFEIGYWIHSSYTGLGIATEATNAVTSYAFTKLKASRVQITAQVANIASAKVAQKCGFTKEATLKSIILDNVTNKPADIHLYSIFDINKLPSLQVKY